MTERHPPVALDAMGGDGAPRAAVEGAVAAHRQGCKVVLVGDEGTLAGELARLGETPTPSHEDGGIEIVHAPEVIEMGEDPAKAIRAKRNASISVCGDLVASGRCSGMVSAGSTGGAVTAAVLKMGRIKGVERPAIATVIPFPANPIVLIDSGANPECKPSHLAQFAIMGALFARHGLGVGEPRVGLLNIGEEEGKGAALHKQAFRLLAEQAGHVRDTGDLITWYRYVGNLEGHHLPTGTADVVVTDGFTGNVVLKLTEGTAKAVVFEALAILSEGRDEASMADLRTGFSEIRRRLNPPGSGGAYLLGVKGNCVIAHGSSDAHAFERALDFAYDPAAAALIASMEDAFGVLRAASVGEIGVAGAR